MKINQVALGLLVGVGSLSLIAVIAAGSRYLKCHRQLPKSIQLRVSDIDKGTLSRLQSYLKLVVLEFPRKYYLKRVLDANWEQWSKSEENQGLQFQLHSLQITPEQFEKFKNVIETNYTLDEQSQEFKKCKSLLSPNQASFLGLYSTLVGKMQLYAMGSPYFPLPIFGAVHLSNEFKLIEHLNLNKPLDVQLTVKNFQKHQRGIIFEIETNVFQNSSLIWSCKSLLLSFSHYSPKSQKQESLSGESVKEFTASVLKSITDNPAGNTIFKVPGDIGRKFASVCGDYNPVHLYSFLAKAFGFPRAIAHGMCILGKVVSFIPLESEMELPLQCTVYFLKPLLIPSSASVTYSMNLRNNVLSDISLAVSSTKKSEHHYMTARLQTSQSTTVTSKL